MQNIKELNQSLVTVFNNLNEGKIQPKLATCLVNTASKIMSAVKLQMSYNEKMKKDKEIEFMEVEKATNLVASCEDIQIIYNK